MILCASQKQNRTIRSRFVELFIENLIYFRLSWKVWVSMYAKKKFFFLSAPLIGQWFTNFYILWEAGRLREKMKIIHKTIQSIRPLFTLTVVVSAQVRKCMRAYRDVYRAAEWFKVKRERERGKAIPRTFKMQDINKRYVAALQAERYKYKHFCNIARKNVLLWFCSRHHSAF